MLRRVKILQPQIATNFGKLWSQNQLKSIFSRCLQSYVPGSTLSVMSKVDQIFANAHVQQRHLVLDPHLMECKVTDVRKNIENYYHDVRDKAIAQFRKFDHSNTVNHLITTTEIAGCPPLDIGLGVKSRQPLIGYGCIGGISALHEAYKYLQHNPDHAVGIYAVEALGRLWAGQFPLVLRRLAKLDILHQKGKGRIVDIYKPIIEQIVIAAIIGDMAAYTIVVGENHKLFDNKGWLINKSKLELFPDGSHLVGSTITEYGTRMYLDSHVPAFSVPRLHTMIKDTIQHQSIKDYSFLLSHPGGAGVIKGLNTLIGNTSILGCSLSSLTGNGNCASASIFDVISKSFSTAKVNDKALITGMGPGMLLGLHDATFA